MLHSVPNSPPLEHEGRETERPLDQRKLPESLNRELQGFDSPTIPFFSSREGWREKLGLSRCLLALSTPGVLGAVSCCRCSKGVFAPWPLVLLRLLLRLLVRLLTNCLSPSHCCSRSSKAGSWTLMGPCKTEIKGPPVS